MKILIYILFPLLIITACNNNPEIIESPQKINKLEKIKERGKLIAITNYNSTDYFIYRGQPMGFQKELLELLAEKLDVKLEIIVENNLDKAFSSLINGKCDIIAISLTTTQERSKLIDFTEPICQTEQVLVQRKPNNWQSLSKNNYEDSIIRNQIEIGDKTIHVQKFSAFKDRINNLSEEIGKNINVVENDSLEVEQLIELVSVGEIDYTVCDENVALVNNKYFSNIDVETKISFPQNVAWAIEKESDSLLNYINGWLTDFKKEKEFIYLYNKYFKNSRSKSIFQSDYFAVQGGSISQYDGIIKTYCEEINWDWRLLSSLIFQESRFQNNVTSWSGAFGLMQIMPATAKNFGIDTTASPSENIRAGIKYIKWLEGIFKEEFEDENERIKFILASYNVGPGHVIDAQNLARKFGKNPQVWDNSVDYYVLHKSNPKFYNDSVVKHGYCRGTEPYKFVKEIINRYEHYKNIIPD